MYELYVYVRYICCEWVRMGICGEGIYVYVDVYMYVYAVSEVLAPALIYPSIFHRIRPRYNILKPLNSIFFLSPFKASVYFSKNKNSQMNS